MENAESARYGRAVMTVALLLILATAIHDQPVAERTAEEVEDTLDTIDDDDAVEASEEGGDEVELEDESTDNVSDERRFSADIDDDTLRTLFEKNPEALGSVSVGFAHAGRLIGGVTFPKDPRWTLVEPARTYGTEEVVTSIKLAIAEVAERFPNTPPLRINHLSSKDGGPQRGHRSHQAGRDVDLAFYYPSDDTARIRAREKVIDVPRTWALVRAIITHGDVQNILLDRRVQAVLRKHAEKSGEDAAWLASIFGEGGIVKHVPHHRDHLHVRYYSPRAQELGRRVQPILALRPEHNLVAHRVKSGETLSRIAKTYGTTVKLITKVNHVSPRALRVGQALAIPLLGPCNQCPLPPPVTVPPRRLPPDVASSDEAASLSVPSDIVVLDGELRAVVDSVLLRRRDEQPRL